tara:strand:- start:481 stop:795 length:315 start_codon:yes stop_codon:yes gene_type:complete
MKANLTKITFGLAIVNIGLFLFSYLFRYTISFQYFIFPYVFSGLFLLSIIVIILSIVSIVQIKKGREGKMWMGVVSLVASIIILLLYVAYIIYIELLTFVFGLG